MREINARARVRINSFQAIGHALSVGHGCFLGSKLYTQELLERGVVKMRPIGGAPILRTLCVAELAGRPRNFLGEMMRDLLTRLISEAIRTGEWEAKLVATDRR